MTDNNKSFLSSYLLKNHYLYNTDSDIYTKKLPSRDTVLSLKVVENPYDIKLVASYINPLYHKSKVLNIDYSISKLTLDSLLSKLETTKYFD